MKSGADSGIGYRFENHPGSFGGGLRRRNGGVHGCIIGGIKTEDASFDASNGILVRRCAAEDQGRGHVGTVRRETEALCSSPADSGDEQGSIWTRAA